MIITIINKNNQRELPNTKDGWRPSITDKSLKKFKKEKVFFWKISHTSPPFFKFIA